MANSRCLEPLWPFSACSGADVMVKPPAWGMEGMWTSSHWPARWVKVDCVGMVSRDGIQ